MSVQRRQRSVRRRLLHRQPAISESARTNRRILIRAMRDAGFVNYPSEWWHWSHGDRYWAAVTCAPAALYAAVEESALDTI
ncbi:M15 family metallopeptidase [Chromobacterium vaccinii]|uniref:M15 family metallopeptidase n=1 Tax=Chromobacterium vaccinii TaxID=1108595 RepID=UPI001C93015E|nr:M15 family metallopeptidase [Chromobacterium vaccinii]